MDFFRKPLGIVTHTTYETKSTNPPTTTDVAIVGVQKQSITGIVLYR